MTEELPIVKNSRIVLIVIFAVELFALLAVTALLPIVAMMSSADPHLKNPAQHLTGVIMGPWVVCICCMASAYILRLSRFYILSCIIALLPPLAAIRIFH